MESIRPWEVGEVVVVERGGWDNRIQTLTIKRVMKRFIELSDGSKWENRPYGRSWPRPKGRIGWGDRAHVRRRRPEDDLKLIQQRVLGAIHDFKQFVAACTEDELRTLLDIAKNQKNRASLPESE